ncbi:hypothetical protein AB4Y77_00065 [Paenarthrobacter sp. YAF11_1]|uniref:hypothetical protein n=1 Tax=Paenarthrobacter sp. YAF11_1 TaxID=3233074 RepID=UPI003F98AF82
MTTELNTIQASVTTLTIDGLTITKDIAKQLDQLHFEDWERFEGIGRIHPGIDHGNDGIELLGKDTSTGALVRMWHVTKPGWVGGYNDGQDGIRASLAAEYSRLPLIVLPKEGRP